jgi:hypothetical protein
MFEATASGLIITETCERTRRVEIRIPGSKAVVAVESFKNGDEPWSPPTVTFPPGRATFEMWKDFNDAIGKAFLEYENKFHAEFPILVVEQ